MVLTIGVVGAGAVGQGIGKNLMAKGHKILYGSRDPASAKAKQILEQQPGAVVDTFQNVTAAADVVILTTPSMHEAAGIQALAATLGPGASKKVILDATNPVSGWPNLEVIWDKGTSGGEILQAALPDSYVFKAFNTIGAAHLADPTIIGPKLTMLYAGAKEQKDVAAQVIQEVGFVPEYVGPIRYARNLEAIAELWIHLSIPGIGGGAETWDPTFNFQVVRK